MAIASELAPGAVKPEPPNLIRTHHIGDTVPRTRVSLSVSVMVSLCLERGSVFSRDYQASPKLHMRLFVENILMSRTMGPCSYLDSSAVTTAVLSRFVVGYAVVPKISRYASACSRYYLVLKR